MRSDEWQLQLPDIERGIQQLYPDLSPQECLAWVRWVENQPNYYIARIGQAICIAKVYYQIDPPWQKLAQEVAWWGRGRDAVRVLHRSMDWARLQGATAFGYSLGPYSSVAKWRQL